MDQRALQSLLKQAGIQPSRTRGQNFLLDEEVVQKMADDAQVSSNDLVIEIGPGLGVLTNILTKRAKRVLAIELEPALATKLSEIINHPNNLDVIQADALSSKAFHARVAWLAQQNELTLPASKNPDYQKTLIKLDQTYKIVANLPYQITSKALRTFLENAPRPSSLTVMVQKEVAERATAKPGHMSLLSLSVQAYSQAQISQIVPAQAFYPVPEVDSAVLHCDLTKPNPQYAVLTDAQRLQFWRLARQGFSSRRKQLRNNLKSIDGIDAILASIGVTPLARAQELTVAQWCELAKVSV